MAARPRLIELGERGWPAETDLNRRVLPRRTRLGLVAGMVTVACLLGLVTSTPAEPALGDPLWTTEVSLVGFSVGSESLYLSEPGARAVSGRWLGTGGLRWRLEIEQVLLTTIDVGGGVAAVLTRDPGPDMRLPPQTTTTLVDEATGQLLSRRPGFPLGSTGSGLLLFEAGRDADCVDHGRPCVDVLAVDPRTGREVWRVSPPPGGSRLAERGPSGAVRRFATVSPDGWIVLRDAATATVVEAAQLPSSAREAQLALVGDVLVAAARGRGQAEVTGLLLGRPQRAWTLTVALSEPPTERTVWLHVGGCGDLVCLRVNGGTAVIDPGTGALRFWAAIELVGQLGDGKLLAAPPAERLGEPTELVLLDPLNGRTVAAFPESVLLDSPGPSGGALIAQAGLERTSFAILDERGQPHSLGSVTGGNLSCQARGAVLACSDPAGLLRVWRLPN